MASLTSTFLLLSIILVLHSFPGESTTFTIVNNCAYTIWPGILSNAGIPQLPTTGFPLQNGESKSITPETGWAGRLWGRTLCSSDISTGKFTCMTGDCGSGKVDCSGSGATPPATLIEFTLSGAGGMDFYDVSLVDGYNLPVLAVPRGGGGANCSYTGCMADINRACPTQLRVTLVSGSESRSSNNAVACKSACGAYNRDEYCCSGEFGSPDTCHPSSYSLAFKTACPRAYSYAYDDRSSTFTCGGSPDYTITFCPSPATSQKATSSSTEEDEGEEPPSSSTSASITNNSTMVYEGALDFYSSAPYTCAPTFPSPVIAGVVSLFTLICQLLF